jgi:hypothetical protein
VRAPALLDDFEYAAGCTRDQHDRRAHFHDGEACQCHSLLSFLYSSLLLYVALYKNTGFGGPPPPLSLFFFLFFTIKK